MINPLVSIIIPFFNVEEYIEDCIVSLIGQTYKNIEIIFIDDCSTDNSSKIVDQYILVDQRLKKLKTKRNTGPGHARNIGLQKANGKYITFVDSDDYLCLDTIALLVKEIQLRRSDILIYNAALFIHNTKKTIDHKSIELEEWFFDKGEILPQYKENLIHSVSCFKIYSTVFLIKNEIKYPENIYGEDVEFWIKCLLATSNISYLNFNGYYRRLRESSIMFGEVKRHLRDRIDNFDELLYITQDNLDIHNYIINKYIPLIMRGISATQDIILITYSHTIFQKLILKYEHFYQPKMKKNKTKPSISIVMAIYNDSDYLKESLNSILNQTFTDFELIIVDDGSTDNSLDIIKVYTDKRICLIESQHNFIESLNKGLSISQGKYIARMDGDDIMLPHRLQTQFDFMETNPNIDICGSSMQTFGLREEIMSQPLTHLEIISSLLLGSRILNPTAFIKRESIMKSFSLNTLYNKDYIVAQDYRLWIDLAMEGCIFANLPDILVKYRLSTSQHSSQHRKLVLERTLTIQEEYLEYVINKMVDENSEYEPILDAIVESYNKDIIKFPNMRQMVYIIYINCLGNDAQKGW